MLYVYSCQHFLWVIEDVWRVLCRPFVAHLKLIFKYFYFTRFIVAFFSLLAVKGIILGPELWHISRWQVHCYRLWRQEGHGVWSDLLDWEVTDWSTQASGGGRGHTQLLTPVTLLVKQTGTALVCLTVCLTLTDFLLTDRRGERVDAGVTLDWAAWTKTRMCSPTDPKHSARFIWH